MEALGMEALAEGRLTVVDWGTTTRGVEPATPNLMEAKQNTTEPQ